MSSKGIVMTTKLLYYTEFNWYGEVHDFWTHARNPEAAKRQSVSKLAKRLGTSRYRVRCYFSGYKDNFKITEKEKEPN